MSIVQSIRPQPILLEKEVTLAATSGTTVGISVPAGTYVLLAGFQNYTAVPDVTTYTLDVTDGTTVFSNDLNFDNTAAMTIKAGATAGLVAAADTIDVVTTISGSPGAIAGRVWALVIDLNQGTRPAASVDREQLA
ncbi:hypothetical protein EBT25_12985 [bacterium]|nr:hypothetical protein [bacterium]